MMHKLQLAVYSPLQTTIFSRKGPRAYLVDFVLFVYLSS